MSKSKLVPYPCGRGGRSFRNMVTKPLDDAVGWLGPIRPDFDPSKLTLAYQYPFTAEWTERGGRGRTQARAIAELALHPQGV